MRAAALALLLLLPLTARAETPAPPEGPGLSATEFEAYATGKTLTYAIDGEVFGAEQYLPGRRVLWAFKGQECRKGQWYEEAGQICFVYEDEGAPQCWIFRKGSTGLSALFQGDEDSTFLSEVAQSKVPLNCAGPDVGV